jgi:hypothetical protein
MKGQQSAEGHAALEQEPEQLLQGALFERAE